MRSSISPLVRFVLSLGLCLGFISPPALAIDLPDSLQATGSLALDAPGWLGGEWGDSAMTPGIADGGGANGAAAEAPTPISPIGPGDNVEGLAGGLNFAIDTPEAIKNFRLSVGDTFAVNVWSNDLRFSNAYTIPFEGRIFLPQVGEVPVNGLTTTQVKTQISGVLAKHHPGLHVSVLLIKPRSIRVFVTGLVGRPAVVTVPALSRMSSALGMAGGILGEGSQRSISIKRYGEKSPLTVDLYRFTHKGDVAGNPILKSGDLINVPPIGGRATIAGSVFRPGTYEILPNETVGDLLTMAHGPKPEATLAEATLVNLASSRREDRYETTLDLTKSELLKRKLSNLDRFSIPAHTVAVVPYRRTYVTVSGAVRKGGTFQLVVGTKLRDVLAKVQGMKPGAGLREVRVYHKVASGEARYDTPVKVDAYKLLFENDESQNIDLEDGDLVLVPDSKDLNEDAAISVYGHVERPGKVSFRSGDRLSDYISRVGGPLPKADLHHVTVTHQRTNKAQEIDAYRILREGHFENDPVLKPGDIVNVPESFFYVANFQDLVNVVVAGAALVGLIRTFQK